MPLSVAGGTRNATSFSRKTERLFTALGQGGKVSMDLQDMFWGAYFGSLTDKFGVQWMFNCAAKA